MSCVYKKYIYTLPVKQMVRVNILPGMRLLSIGMPRASIARYVIANVVPIVLIVSFLILKNHFSY